MAVPSAPTQPRDNRSILSGLTGETSVYSTLDTDALLDMDHLGGAQYLSIDAGQIIKPLQTMFSNTRGPHEMDKST